jgi:hypothetical protein
MLIHRRIQAFILILAALSLAACVNARVGDGEDGVGTTPDGGGGGGGEDGGGGGGAVADAAPSAPDAARQDVSLTQSDVLDIVGDNSVACGDETTIAANSYYRVFDLGALGVDGTFRVDTVTFGVQEATSTDGSGRPATVKIHTLDGALQVNNLTEVASQDTVIQELAPDPPGEIGGRLHEVSVDATVPAGSIMVVELAHDDLGEDEFLLVGSNRANQRGPTYVRSPTCGQGEPTDIDGLTDEKNNPIVMHWVLVVDGQTGG